MTRFKEDQAVSLVTKKGEIMSYGTCPSCEAESPKGTSRDRHPDGYTTCGACWSPTRTRNWQDYKPVRRHLAKLRIGIAQIEAIWNKWGNEPSSGGERTAEIDFLMAIGEVLESLREPSKPNAASTTASVALNSQELDELPVGSVVRVAGSTWVREVSHMNPMICWKCSAQGLATSAMFLAVGGAVLVSRGEAPAERG